MFKAFVGYQIDDNDNAIFDASADFESKSEAQDWVEFMLNMNGEYDFATIEEVADDFESQVNEFEAQEEARRELGIPKDVF
jgi:hypothetical protein